MSAADNYLATSGSLLQAVPGFQNVKSDTATAAFLRAIEQNASIESSLAGAALTGRANVRASELELQARRERNATELKVAELARKPTLAQKLSTLASLGGAVSGSRQSRMDLAAGLVANATQYAGSGVGSANNALANVGELTRLTDAYGAGSRAGLGDIARAISTIQPSALPAPITDIGASANVAPAPPPTPRYEFTGATAPQISQGSGQAEYLKWIESNQRRTGQRS